MLHDIVRREMTIEGWMDSTELVKRVLVHLNNLHSDAVQKMLAIEGQIRAAGDEPLVKVTVVFPDPPPMPEPEPEEPL